MAQDKKVFTGGMDKDSDPRLIKGGDYRDALNIRNISSSDSTSGSVENIEGNTLVPFNFIDETDQLIEVTPIEDSNEYIEEIDLNQVFNQVTIDITGKETAHYSFNFSLGYLTPQGNENAIEFSPISWSGNSSQTNTSTTLYNQFGPGGPLSVIQVDDINTGLPVTLVAEINFESGDVFNGGTILSITYTCTQAGAQFTLFSSSSYNDDNIIFGAPAEVLSDPIDIANYLDQNNSMMSIGGSVSSITTTGDLGGNSDDEGNVFGPGVSTNTEGTIIDLEISGTEPTSNTDNAVEEVDLYSYTQAGGDGSNPSDWLVSPAIDLSTASESFGSGGEFEFDTNQDSIAGFLTDIVTDEDKLNNILVDGGNGTTTSLGDISTNFLEGTKLQGNNSGAARNNPSEVSYSQLEYYYDSTEVIEGDGFTINEGTLTFGGDTVLSQNTYPLKSSLIEDKGYLLSFTVSGLTSGLSFNFNMGNQEFAQIDTNGIHTLYVTPENNTSIIYIKFNKDFTSSDEVVITNLRLFLEDVPVDIMSIRLSSIGSSKFNLAFASSEEQLKKDLSEGKQSTQIREWFPGVALSLTTKNVGDGYGVIAGVQLADLQAALLEANQQIALLTSQINSQSSASAVVIADLEAQLLIATNNADQLQVELDAANNLYSILQEQSESINESINAFLLEQGDIAGLDPLVAYAGTNESVSSSLALISAAIAAMSTSTIHNEELQQEIDDYIETINELNSQITSLDLDINALNAQIVEVTNTQNSIQQSLNEANNSITSLQNQLSDAETLNTQEVIDLIALHEARVAALLLDYAELEADLAIALANEEAAETAATEATAAAATAATAQAAAEDATTSISILLDNAIAGAGVIQTDLDAVEAALDAAVLANGILQSEADVIQTALEVALANEEDGVTQADVDAAVATLQVNLDATNSNLLNVQAELATALANQEDGIGQADVDAIQVLLDEANNAIELIEQEAIDNPSVIDLTEHVINGDFENGADDWNPVAVHDFTGENIHVTGAGASTNLMSDISAGEYIVSVNITNHVGGSLTISIWNADYTSQYNLPEIFSAGRHIFNVSLPEGDKSMWLITNADGLNDDINFTIDDVSMVSASSATGVTASTISNFISFTESLKAANDSLISANDALGLQILALTSDLEDANINVALYTTTLSELNNNLNLLGTSLISAISELSVTSSMTQEQIDNYIASASLEGATLSEQSAALNDLIVYLTNQIVLLELDFPSLMLTFSGAVPVTTTGISMGSWYLRIKNNNDSSVDIALQILDDNSNKTYKRGSIRSIHGETYLHNPVLSMVYDLNELAGFTTYNSFLQLQSDPTQYITSPAEFIVPVDVNGEIQDLKFIIHNINFENQAILIDGTPYHSASFPAGFYSNYVGARGEENLEEDYLGYLETQGINNGIQIEVILPSDAAGGGWTFGAANSSSSGTITNLSNQYTQELFNTGNNEDYQWTLVSNWSAPDSDYHPSGYQSFSISSTYKTNVESSNIINSEGDVRGSAGSFIAEAAAPNFSIANMAVSDELIYPAQTADIIVSKSKDVPPNLSEHITGAKRFVRNTKLKKTTVRDNSSSSYKCIGTYEDKPKNSIYYFVHHSSGTDKFDCILEYSLMDNKIRTVYQDGRQGSNGLIEGILNFDLDHAITGVNKVDDILYWTDNLNRPRKINVTLGKNNEVNISKGIVFEDVNFPGSHSNSVFLSYSDIKLKTQFSIGDTVYTHTNSGDIATSYNGYAEVLGIIRKMPDGLTFNTTDTENEVTSSVALTDSQLEAGEWIGIMDNTNFPRFYQVANISGTTITTVSPLTFTLTAALALYLLPSGGNIGGLLTNCPFQSFSAVSGIIMSADPSDAYSPLISFGKYEDKMRYFDVIKHQPLKRPVTVLATDTSYAKNNILDTLFQFKYRYSHQDNENTSYSSISNINIDPEFARNTPLKHSEYRETANTIEVEYFDTISDVKKIEITTRKGNDGEFTLVDTVQNNFIKYLKVLKNEVIVDPDYYFVISKSIIKFRNNGVYPFINKSEGDKLFDAVPKLAKAQTIISDNRLTYGNILEGYDNTPLVVSSSFNADGPIIQNNESNFPVYGDPNGSNYEINNVNTGSNNTNLALLLTGDDILQTGFPFSSITSWTSGGSSQLRLSLFIDLSGIDLNNENSQNLSFDINYGLERDVNFLSVDGNNSNKKRAGRIAMNVDITGLDTITKVRNKVISQFSQDNWEGGTKIGSTDTDDCQKDEGGDSNVSITSSGISKLKLFWKHKANSNDSSGGGLGWASINNGWKNVTVNVTAKLLSGDAGFNTFKTGAFHDFGISYFDETNRCSFVNVAPDYGQDVTLQEGYNTTSVSANLNGTRSYNPFPAEPNGSAIGQTSSLNLKIYNKPPSWATSYQVMYAGNTSVDEFMQVTVPHAIPGVGGDTQMYLSLQSLKSHKASYTEATGALTDFDVAKGDRIRFISCDTTSGRKKFNDYLDFEITGFEFYNEEPADVNGNPIAVASGQEGFYIRISNPGSDLAQLDGSPDVSINHSGFSLSGSGYDKLIAELYRPKKTQTPESTVYFELGDRLEIGNPGELNNYHSGNEDQNPEYFYDKDVNTTVSLTPAVINIDEGDIYIKSRNMFTVTNGGSLEGFPCESYYLNDFHSTNHYDKGRINVVNNNAEERNLSVSVYYSEPYISTGAINGLSSFNLANSPYFDYNKEFGSIQSLKTKDNDLIIFHESKVGRVLVGQDILNTASGEGLVSLSNDVISNYVSLYAGQFGCGLNPESIVKHGQKFYFADIKRGAILRLSTDGLTVISEYGMKDYFRDLGEMYVKYNPDGIKTFSDSFVGGNAPYLLIGGYDPKYDEYIITFPEIEGRGRNYVAGNASTIKNWSDGILNWDDATLDPNMKNDKILFNAVTLGFSEGTNKWTSFYSYIPDFYSKINKQFVSFKQGRVYRHNDSDLYSLLNSDFNNFYGNGNLSYIDFVFNAEPSSVKSYNAIGLESDTKFITGMFTNTGQHYGNYDDVATTSIAFKKVVGTISGDPDSNLITGYGTEFYESVTPGDLVRVFGYIKNNYTHRDFIVTKVISNTLISVNELLEINVVGNSTTNSDSYMLVIDYKTKEGIQYSSIPFVTSGLSSTADNFQFGDGSEMQGLGVASGIDVFLIGTGNLQSGTTAHKFESVDMNRPLSPSQMILGGKYALQGMFYGSAFNISDVDPSVNSNSVGTIFTCKTPNTDSTAKVISTDIKLYVKNPDNTTTFLGYPYSQDISSDKLFFVPTPAMVGIAEARPGFYFTVKSGEVEGEKMKGSYMRTILATNKSQSKKKFNLYAANADVDKSELSNR